MFGSSTALTESVLSEVWLGGREIIMAVPSSEWYAVLRKCLAELGEDEMAMTAIMGGNAADVHELGMMISL